MESVTLKIEHRLMVFNNRMPKNIFGPKREGVTGDWRKLPNEELSWLVLVPEYYLGDETKDTEMDRVRVVYGGEDKFTLPFVGKTEGKKNHLEDLKEMGGEKGAGGT
jgi:hypothetical protein